MSDRPVKLVTSMHSPLPGSNASAAAVGQYVLLIIIRRLMEHAEASQDGVPCAADDQIVWILNKCSDICLHEQLSPLNIYVL